MPCKGSVVLQTEGSKQIGVECIHVIEGLSNQYVAITSPQNTPSRLYAILILIYRRTRL